MKSKEKLLSFIQYCNQHPGERFWQALCNWSEYDTILGRKGAEAGAERAETLEDTFYKE